ncbi:ABC transporter ATP-binding protein [Carnobacteriaceae bacterium 52-44]|jgi:ATP-binding cassette subfamily B protein
MKNLHLFKRSTKDLWTIGKKYYALLFVQKLSSASIPFISFVYMTRVVQALTNQQSDEVISLVIQYLVIFGILQLLSSLITPYVEQESDLVHHEIINIPYKKMLRMQYHYADSAKINEQLNHIRIANLNQQSSLAIQNVRMPFIIESFIQTVWALVLLTPLWQSSITNLNESWAWVNSPWVFLAILIGIAAILLLQFSAAQEGQEKMRETAERSHHGNNILNYELTMLDDIESGKEVRLYQLEDHLQQNQQRSFEHLIVWMKEIYYAGIGKSTLVTILAQFLNFFTYAIIGIRVLLGFLPIGYIIQLSSALSQLLTALPNLIQYVAMSFSQPQTLIDFYKFMDLPEEKSIGSLPIEKRLDNEYELAVKNMDFTYPDSDEVILKNINIDFEVGKKYAIVGENGSGKTTFIKLLMRLYEPSEGEVLLNKIDAQKYKLTEYFQLFSVVFQDFRLLGLNLGQNIAVNQQYDEELAMTNLEEIGLNEFIETLPKGLETYLGKEFDNSGVQMSGGQSQKVAMARALYKDSPIMILDEPTAALDPVAEFEIYQKFDEIVEDKTSFYISHRLSSSRFSDEILVFDEGKIVQKGSHEELVNKPGKYHDLWNAQAQYYQ